MSDAQEDTVDVELDDDERRVLMTGLVEWAGPARPTDELAQALGFDTVSHLLAEARRIRDALETTQPMSRLDWTRALAATEFVFISDVFGSGYEWETTTGLKDVATLMTLRRLQRKLVHIYGPAVGTLLGHRPSRQEPPASGQPPMTGADYYWDNLN